MKTNKNFRWKEINGGIEITKYIGSDTNVIIPKTINNIPVVSIGWCSFEGHTDLKSITMPNSIVNIEYCAFYDCANLKSVTIPNNVTSIGIGAFAHCISLKTIKIPNGITKICNSTFYNCESLETIIMPNTIMFIGDIAFGYCTSLKVINLPSGINDIGKLAFYGCTSLETIALPNTVTSIDNGIFRECTELKTIIVPNSILSIGEWAFNDCKKLKCPTFNYKACNIVDNKFVCRDTEYEIGKWSETIGNIKIWYNGYHYCTNLFDIFNSYDGKLDEEIAIFEVEVGDKVIVLQIKLKIDRFKICNVL